MARDDPHRPMTPDAVASPTDELHTAVVECLERTLAAPRARIEFTREWSFTWPEDERRARRRGGLLRPVGKLAKAAGKAAGKAAWRHWTSDTDPTLMRATGIVEPRARRHMINFGPYAEVYMDGTRWGGRSGRPVAAAKPRRPERHPDLWWLLDAVRGTTDATLEGEETLHGASCRRIAVHVDLERASALAPTGMQVPSVERFEELRGLPVTVWIDDVHVRRVRFRQGDAASTTLTLDLLEFDQGAGELDWDRLPASGSPETA